MRKDHSPQNMATLRQISHNQLKRETSLKVGIQGKRLQAGWREDYLLNPNPPILGTAERLLEAVRAHWSIENSLHWSLASWRRRNIPGGPERVRKDHSPRRTWPR